MNKHEMAINIWEQMGKKILLKDIKQMQDILFSNIDGCLKLGDTFKVKKFGTFYNNPSGRKRLRLKPQWTNTGRLKGE